MAEDRLVAGLIARLRVHVAELRRLERDEAHASEIAERERLVMQLQSRLANTVRDLVRTTEPAAVAA